ncbi:porin family protein, partial [Psychrobacter sp. 1Y4]
MQLNNLFVHIYLKELIMKTLQKTILALATGSLLSVGAQAAVNYGNGYTGQP